MSQTTARADALAALMRIRSLASGEFEGNQTEAMVRIREIANEAIDTFTARVP